MKFKIFFVLILIGLSLQAQTSGSSDELDVIDDVDVTATQEPAPAQVPEKEVTPAASEALQPVISVIIPRVYQVLMPQKKQHELTPSLFASNTTADDKNLDDVHYSNSTVLTGVNYLYGIGNNQSLGASVNFATHINRVTAANVETSVKKNGLGNPILHYKGLLNIGRITFFGLGHYSFKLEKETFDTIKKEGNAAAGQNRISLTVGGYKAINADYILGALVNYNKAQDGERLIKSASGSETLKLAQGDRMYTGIFMEIQNEWHPNISLGFSKEFSLESADEFDNKSYSINMDYIHMSASAQFQTDTNIFFVPEISYLNGIDNEAFKKYNKFTFYGGLRFLFNNVSTRASAYHFL